MNEITNIENSLEASTAKDNLLDIIGGAADYSLENFLEMGDGIPIVSYFTKGVKATLAIRDFLFMEKVIEFLKEVGKEPTANRKKMIDKIQEDSDYSEKFGKVSLVAIERFDDIEKAKLLGKVARYLSRGEFNFEVYKRYAFIIDKMYTNDIVRYAKIDASRGYKMPNLESLGLIQKDLEVVQKTYSGSLEDLASRRTPLPPDSVKAIERDTLLGQTLKNIMLDRAINYLQGYVMGTPQDHTDELNEQYGNNSSNNR